MSGAGFGIPNSAGDFASKLEGDGDVKLGDSSGDVIQITGSIEMNENLFFLNDGKIGIGDSAPSFKLSVGGSMEIGQYIYHKGDNNTFINFTDNRIRINAGGNNHIDCEDKSSAPHKVRINNGGNNIDFVIKDNSNNVYLTADASTSRIGIGTDTPSTTLDVAGDVNFDGSAVFNESSADKDFRVESNHNTHMFYIDGGSNRIGIGNNSPQTVLDITDPLDAITGAEVDAIIRLRSKRDVGIKLIADTANTTGETDNPFIDYYADSLTDATGRGNRLASMALEGTAGTTFTDSIAGAYFLDAFCPNHTPSNLRPLQIANDSSNNGHKARITIEGTNGYVGVWTSTPSHALEVDGQFKVNEEAIFGTTSTNLGSGATSTLTPASSVHLLTATSITSGDTGMHTMTLADGTTAGQILKIILVTTTNNEPIMISTTNILGGSSFSAIGIENNKQGAAIEFIWTGSAWAVMGNNSLASVQ